MSILKVDSLDSDNKHIIFGGIEQLDLSSNKSDIIIPRGTSESRPRTSSNGLITGALYYNTDLKKLQYYNGWEWRNTDGSRDYVEDGLVFYIDAANPESFTKENVFQPWTYYGSGSTHTLRLDNNGVVLYNTSTDWVGYFDSYINTALLYYLEFEYWSDVDGSVLVLDNDGVNNNSFNQTFTADTYLKKAIIPISYTSTGLSQFFFRRDSGGNIWLQNVRLFNAYQDEYKNVGVNTFWGEIRAQNGVTWNPEALGCWIFDGSNDWIKIPDFSREDTRFDSSSANTGDSLWNNPPNLQSVTMEIVLKQNSSKALEVFGTDSIVNIAPDAGFSFFPGSNGFMFVRFVEEGGDRPHRRARDVGANLSDGNWHYYTGTYSRVDDVIRLYKNGTLVDESRSTNLSSSFQGNIGGQATSYAFNGRLALAKIYSKALTASEVKRNFNSVRHRFGL
jgi:hypothetical protein